MSGAVLRALAAACALLACAAAAGPHGAGPGATRVGHDEARGVLDAHNRARARVGVGPLAWSDELAAHAQAWASHLAARGCVLKHRPASGPWRRVYGENLYAGPAGGAASAEAAAFWVREGDGYRGGPLTREEAGRVGHYTQVVWRETAGVGCGRAECGARAVVVCSYDPPGNVLGRAAY